MARDDFLPRVKSQLALRVNYRCSNPDCKAATSGPQVRSDASVNIGVAAHITAASSGGPRFDPSLTLEERVSAENGIWLCQNCAKLTDNDERRFPKGMLQEWKRTTEADALNRIGKTPAVEANSTILDSIHGQLRRQSNPRFGFSFLHPAFWDREDPQNGDGNTYRHPAVPQVEIRAWGGYAVLQKHLCGWVDQTLEWCGEKDGFALLTKVPSGRDLVDWDENGVEFREQVEGCRITYQSEVEGNKVTAMQTFVQYSDTQVVVFCQAPTACYLQYEELFLVISHEIRILGRNSAPYARTGVIGTRTT